MRRTAPPVRRLTCALALLMACAARPGAGSSGDAGQVADVVIHHVRVVHGDGRVTPNATVIVRAGIIDTILAAPTVTPAGQPPSRSSIDGTGRTLLPGLIDAHVRLESWMLPRFLALGVTAVRDLHTAGSDVFPLAAGGRSDRPLVVASGATIDSPGGGAGPAISVDTVGEARTAVRTLVESGARVISVSPRLGPVMLSVVVSEARARGVPVAARLGATTATQAADAGVASIEHVSGVVESAGRDASAIVAAHADPTAGWTAAQLGWRRLSLQRLEEVARELAGTGVVLVPTLALHEATYRLADPDITRHPDLAHVPGGLPSGAWDPATIMARAGWTPQTLSQFRQAFPILQQFVATFSRVGGRVVTGTGAGQPYVVPGVSLHRELELLVACGLSPGQAIKAATADAADLLGILDRAGTIDAGKAADFVLVDGNPLIDIRHSRRIVAVFRDGNP
ncbi:MAG: amidohydrolase family protein [Vicinamibacterales bacterium]|nr:amidohydrolase family protein [Vicinamibacterales bacterium]